MHITPRTVRLLLPVSFALLALGAWRLAPQRPDDVKIETQAVSGPVSMLVGMGGNIGVSAGPDGVFVIDDQFLELAPRIRTAIDALQGSSKGGKRLLVNTHHHGDHTGGNPEFGRDSTILAQTNVRARLAVGDDAMDPIGLPVLTYDEGLNVHINGEDIALVHYPACHTDGDSVVFFTGSNVVHMGDLMFNGLFPFIDIDGGGSLTGLRAGVAAVLARTGPDTKIIPGHGPLATRADLAAYADMLATTEGLVTEALSAGETVEQMLANGLLQDYESWSWNFIGTQRYLETLVRDISGR